MKPLDRLRRTDPRSLAAPYALDALEPAERARFEKHLDGCARCAAEGRALSEDAARLARSTAVPAPPALRDRVLAAVRATPQDPAPPAAAHARTARPPSRVRGTEPHPARPPAPRMRPLLVPFATATAAGALVVAALFAVQAARTQDDLTAERDRAREIAHVLAAPRRAGRDRPGRRRNQDRSNRFRFCGARGRHRGRTRRPAARPGAPAVARAPGRPTALPRPP